MQVQTHRSEKKEHFELTVLRLWPPQKMIAEFAYGHIEYSMIDYRITLGVY